MTAVPVSRAKTGLQLMSGSTGGEAVLRCTTEAFPVSINYWTKDNEEALMPSHKYDVSNVEKGYKVHMVLRIRELETR